MDRLTKLSDAIRLGATFRPQCAGVCNVNGASCAIAAAYEAAFGELPFGTSHAMNRLQRRFRTDDPELFNEIMIRNDTGKWTREQIADWLQKEGY